MLDRSLQNVIYHLRRAVGHAQPGDVTDAQLLDAFVRTRDQTAFELLVWRHAAMVLGACRRLLHDRHEAEDAFQATFLVLVRKAASISKRDSVGCWLHRVACRIARRARIRAVQRPHHTLPAEGLPARDSPDEVQWRDLREVLDEEVERLPEKYRRPFVLCYLEGNTNEQAAHQLGCPMGTLVSWLSRGRERLRNRLARRGVLLSGTLLATLSSSRSADAVPPASLVKALVEAAIPFAAGNAAGLVSARTVAWTEGVLQAMFLTRLKISVAVVLLLALVASGSGLLTRTVVAEPRAPQAERERPRAEARPAPGDARAAAARSEVRGVLEALDADKITVAVTGDGRGETVKKTFTVARNAEVGVTVGIGRRGAFREAKLADLAPGALVALQLSEDEKAVQCILADGPTIRGVLKAVNAEKGTLTIGTVVRPTRREEAPEEKEQTWTLAKGAEVALDDGRGRTFSLKETRLVDLPIGALATVKLSTDLKHVLFVQAEGPVVQGVVKAVNPGKREIQLTTRGSGRREDAGEEKTVTVSPTADILLDDGKGRRFSLKEGKLEEVPAGALAMLKLTADQTTATVVQVQGPSAYGPVKAVDAGKGTITLIVRPGRGDTPAEEKTYTLAKDVHVIIDGKDSKLTDVKADENGPPVWLRLSLDQKAVQSITVGAGAGRR
jgi:RNA polymerase sigma factor (sigma-70 family)